MSHGKHGNHGMFFTKTEKTLLSVLKLFQSFCAKCYVLVFKNKLLSQFHTTFHIHYRGFKPFKRKTLPLAEKPLLRTKNFFEHGLDGLNGL